MFGPEDKVPYLSLCMTIATLYASWKLAWKLIRLCSFAKRHCRRPLNLKERYGGEDSYVVVTGGSDGVGLEICHYMAQ